MSFKRSVHKLALFAILLLGGVLLARPPQPARAQANETPASQPSAYWRYDAAGPLGKVVVADVDASGIDDFIAVTDSSTAVLLDASGQVQWSYQTPGQTAIVQASALNVDGAQDARLELLLATEDELFLLDHNGNLIWRKPLDLPPIPTVLLTGSIDEARQDSFNNRPIFLSGFDRDMDGNEELLVLLQSGLVQLYDQEGELIWKYPESPPVSDEPIPLLTFGDLEGDGRQELVFSYFIRYSRLVVLDSEGRPRWERSLSGRITALKLVPWAGGGGLDIAIGKNFRDEERQVVVYDASGGRRWFRTPNRTITDLQVAQLPGGQALLVGTDVGTVTAYDRQGHRLWRYLPQAPDRGVSGISPHVGQPVREGQPALAFTLAPLSPDNTATASVVLLDGEGRELQRYPSASASGQTRLVDINGDQINELMLASFGTLALTDPGTGARKNAQSWDYRLFAAPLSLVVADLNQDQEDELLVGTRDGQLHILEGNSGQAGAIVNTGGELSQLALLPTGAGGAEILVVAVHNHAADSAQGSPATGYVELIQPSGRAVWSDPIALPGAVNSLATGNVNRDGAAEIVVGTSEGLLLAFSPGAREVWRHDLGAAVTQLYLVDHDDDGSQDVVAVTEYNEIYRVRSTSDVLEPLAYLNLNHVQQLLPLPQGERDLAFILSTDDGLLRHLTWEGAQPWQMALPQGRATVMTLADTSLLVATNEGDLLNLDLQGDEILWQLQNLGQISAVLWSDLDGGGTHDVAVGTRGGQIFLYTSDARQWDTVNLSSNSSVFALAGVRTEAGRERQLAVVTDNGVLQLYEAKPNRPPLLIDPRVEVGSGRYDVRVTVVEEEGDSVVVALQRYDAQQEAWVGVDQRTVSGRDNLLFPIPPHGEDALNYRFVFDDGTHRGVVTPPAGPPGPPARSLGSTLIIPVLVAALLFSAVLVVRQSFNVDARARRFYRRLQQAPTATLRLLEAQYRQVKGSPDFLLSLGNRARPDRNVPLVNVMDGLFLLAGRPGAALAILDSALQEANTRPPYWDGLRRWRQSISLSRDLLDAPSVTELSLLRPQLEQLLQQHGSQPPASDLQPFLAVLANLRDCERVDLVEDRLVYLHEALAELRQIEEDDDPQLVSVGAQIRRLLVERLSGLVKADMERLRGQAQLVVTLKTKRIVPVDGKALVALELQNRGRAAARAVAVTVEPDAAYEVDGDPDQIAVLTPGRSAVVECCLRPGVEDRFRVAVSIAYNDRSQQQRRLQFADMIHLLPPQRDFSPIANPYLPGTPLRGDSPLFYGREELFDFIVENAGQLSRRNVLILVGQRRTGKTSALLRLDRHLPGHIIPIYVDCQSLGVMPGMPALFHDLAWHIADALSPRGYDVQVPEASAWREDPTRLFRRDFLPAVQQQLPPQTILLLVFDEFEAFENLVNDGILPTTLFTYMRHLMQHSEGLSFAFVGTRRLEEMTSNYWSVLFNIALYRQIGFLSEAATKRLITEPVAPNIVYDDLALDKIWRVTAGHPYFLQLVCYTLVKRANHEKTGYVTISDVNAALEEMLRLGEVHFAYIWQRSTYTERALLTAVAHLMERDVPFHPSDLVQYLEQYGFRFDPADVTAGLNSLVERQIMREITAEGTTYYELKIGLVGLWAAQNKSLSKLYESKNGANGSQSVRAGLERA